MRKMMVINYEDIMDYIEKKTGLHGNDVCKLLQKNDIHYGSYQSMERRNTKLYDGDEKFCKMVREFMKENDITEFYITTKHDEIYF